MPELMSRIALAALLAGTAVPVGGPSPAGAATLPAVPPALSCAGLLNLDLTGLEGAPARVETATEVRENTPKPYCAVTGYAAPAVRFEVRLPLEGWTQRFLMLGCGGFCGLVNVENPGLRRASSDLGHRRHATFGGDSLWALGNPAAMVDFAYAGMHKSTLVAKALIRAFYGQAQRHAYFAGCSDGGREGLIEAQRFPEDYEGILVGAPVVNEVSNNTFYHGWNVRVNARADGRPILTAAKIPALAEAVRRACGDESGLIQDPRACRFEPRALICPSGEDRADCLTAEQVTVVERLYHAAVDETGRLMHPGNMPRGSEPGWIGTMVPARDEAITIGNSSDAQYAWDLPNYMANLSGATGITYRNMEFTAAGFRQLMELSGLYDAANPDLRAFAARGGRLILWHGWADTGVPPELSLNYRAAVRRFMGEEAADRFMALYMLPGVYHCTGGPAPSNHDLLTPLLAWVEEGQAPGRITMTFQASATDPRALNSRPVFPYPATVRYRGEGDPKDAANYIAAPPAFEGSDRVEWLGSETEDPARQVWCGWETLSFACRPRGPSAR
jgi:feruloyl esterase